MSYKETVHKDSFSSTRSPTSTAFSVSGQWRDRVYCPHAFQPSPWTWECTDGVSCQRGTLHLLIPPGEAQASWAVHHHPDSLPRPSVGNVCTLSLSLASCLESSTSSLKCPGPSYATCTSLPGICLKCWLLFSHAPYASGHRHGIDVLLAAYYSLETLLLPSSFRNSNV